MIASVSGIRMRHVVPVPTVDSTSTEPPMASMFVRTTSIPTPRPDTFVTFAAVEKPGRNSRSSSSDGALAAAAAAGARPRRAQTAWSDGRARGDDHPYARAFLFLLDELAVVDAQDMGDDSLGSRTDAAEPASGDPSSALE